MRPASHSGARRSCRRAVLLSLATVAAALCVPAAALPRASAALPTAIGKGEGSLSLLALPGYAEKEMTGPFQRSTGCKVRVQYASSSDDTGSQMRGGGVGIDLVLAAGDESLRLVRNGDVAPVNAGLVRGWKDYYAAFKGPPANTAGGRHYGISAQFAPNLLLYNSAKIKRPPTSWAVLYVPTSRRRVTVPDNPMFIADAALYLAKAKPGLGIRDPYELTNSQFSAVLQLLRAQRPLVSVYWATASDQIESFRTGGSTLGAGWPYQQVTLRERNKPVRTTVPKEGMTGWLDSWMLSSKAKHPNCAYKWLNYVASPAVQARQAVSYGATPVNKNACPYMNKLEKSSCKDYRANGAEQYYRSIRLWKTPLLDCGDARGDTCVPYSQWVRAWAELRK
jgi:putative spermidine/putrescine transport system substrate-binding protein